MQQFVVMTTDPPAGRDHERKQPDEGEVILPPQPAPVSIRETIVVRPRPPDLELKAEPERVFAAGEWKNCWR